MTGAAQAVSLIEVALREPAKSTIRKHYNLVELCLAMHGFGVGKRVTRTTWDWYPNSYYTISRIVVTKMVHIIDHFAYSLHIMLITKLSHA
jgi:hypothetical protein